MIMKELMSYDEILITGTTSNPSGRKFEELRATVDCVSGDYVKVWPDTSDPQLTKEEAYNGKFWFNEKEIEHIELLLREE